MDSIRRRSKVAADEIALIDIRRGGNGLIVLTANGIRNHRREGVIELFQWVAAIYPQSFGLLHVWDDEHRIYDNCFRVYRFAHGNCTEMDDPHLSPCIPTIELPNQSEAEQDGDGDAE
jgi:hypothetical protein